MYLAVDIGGTKTLVALLNEAGEIVASEKFPTETWGFSNFMDHLIEVINSIKSSHDIKAIGVGIPGIVDYKTGQGIRFGNLPWENVPIRKILSDAFSVPIIIDNDANMAGLAEAHELRKTEHPDAYAVMYITVSTGIGTGLILDGKIDPHLAKSEGGHMMFLHDGKLQTWQSFASGKAIKSRFGKYGYEIPEGDPAWAEIAHNLSLGIGNIMVLLVPDAIIIGGGIGTHLDKFKDHLEKYLSHHSAIKFLGRSTPEIYQAKHPEQAVIYGCKIAIDQYFDQAK